MVTAAGGSSGTGRRNSPGNRRRVRKSGRTQAAARDALLAEIHARLDLHSQGPVSESMLVKKAIEVYFDHRFDDAWAGIGRATVRSVRQYRSIARLRTAPTASSRARARDAS